MIALIQRVTRASVTVADEVTGEIGPDFWCSRVSKKMTTNKKLTAYVSACWATAFSAMRKAR